MPPHARSGDVGPNRRETARNVLSSTWLLVRNARRPSLKKRPARRILHSYGDNGINGNGDGDPAPSVIAKK